MGPIRPRRWASLRLPDANQLVTALEINAWALVTHDRNLASVQDVRILK
jgi:predicted nucleic acid-binding protein